MHAVNDCQFGFIYSDKPNVFHLLTSSVLKGDSFRIQGMREWKCGCMTRILLDIGLSDPNISTHYCTNCNKNDFKDSILWVWSKHFVPTIDSSYVEYIEVNQSENAALN